MLRFEWLSMEEKNESRREIESNETTKRPSAAISPMALKFNNVNSQVIPRARKLVLRLLKPKIDYVDLFTHTLIYFPFKLCSNESNTLA